jgi:predicted nucleic acid-binding protein
MLSAIIGGNARHVFADSRHRFITTKNVWDEVLEYLPVLAAKKKLSLSLLMTASKLLPVEIIPELEYTSCCADARVLVGERDPDDVPLLALALAMKCPIWSNDGDLVALRPKVEVFTTAEMLSLRT